MICTPATVWDPDFPLPSYPPLTESIRWWGLRIGICPCSLLRTTQPIKYSTQNVLNEALQLSQRCAWQARDAHSIDSIWRGTYRIKREDVYQMTAVVQEVFLELPSFSSACIYALKVEVWFCVIKWIYLTFKWWKLFQLESFCNY